MQRSITTMSFIKTLLRLWLYQLWQVKEFALVALGLLLIGISSGVAGIAAPWLPNLSMGLAMALFIGLGGWASLSLLVALVAAAIHGVLREIVNDHPSQSDTL
jgi:hypothetical protein